MVGIKVSPSIIAANFACLGQEIKLIEQAGADYVHIDVMDGHFVPNITIGPDVIKDLRLTTRLPFDVHLMIEQPEKYIDNFAKAGSDIITVHYEACSDLQKTINQIKRHNILAGISIKPETETDVLDNILSEIDFVLVMTVSPGFSGQKFMLSQLNKIATIRKKIINNNLNCMINVDGGINDSTAIEVINAGADIIVVGSYIFSGNKTEYKHKIQTLKEYANKRSN